MKRIDGILASLALALSVALMAGLVGTDAYANAAAGEAAGNAALFHVVADRQCDVAVIAANEVEQ
jgi:hypothetical protein